LGNGTYHPSAGFTPVSTGSYWWFASYGGDLSDNPAASACGGSMAETVVPASASASPPIRASAPALSGVKVGSRRFGARKGTSLKLTVSQLAGIRVLITQTVTGHKVTGVCERHAKTGRRCTATLIKRILTFAAREGANVFKLKLPGLAKGAYTATITAQNANGTSQAIKLTITITHK
jgi:hypothetical protein